jgi:RNA polymerase sigma factor (sigma-70 family)
LNAERLAELYRTYAPMVHARARRLLGSDADDVVQEVFLKLVRHEPPQGAELKWMYATATNTCLDRMRANLRKDAGWQGDVRTAESQRRAVSLEEAFASAELCRALLARVDEKTRAIAVLVYVDQMTQQEAADVLDLSRKTVGERLQKLSTAASELFAVAKEGA